MSAAMKVQAREQFIHRLEDYYTYSDYLRWDTGDIRHELIDGRPYAMASPAVGHQKVLMELAWRIRTHLEGKECVIIPDIDVRLNHDEADDTVVRPDLVVVCDSSKIDEKSVKGAPDLVIEILSPSTAKYDKTIKLAKYRKAGVKELWYVDYRAGSLEVLTLKNGEYVVEYFYGDDQVSPHALPDLVIDLSEILMVRGDEDAIGAKN